MVDTGSAAARKGRRRCPQVHGRGFLCRVAILELPSRDGPSLSECNCACDVCGRIAARRHSLPSVRRWVRAMWPEEKFSAAAAQISFQFGDRNESSCRSKFSLCEMTACDTHGWRRYDEAMVGFGFQMTHSLDASLGLPVRCRSVQAGAVRQFRLIALARARRSQRRS